MLSNADASKDYLSGYTAGKQDGRSEVLQEILTHLQEEYVLGDDERGSPRADALLKVTKDLSQKFRQA